MPSVIISVKSNLEEVGGFLASMKKLFLQKSFIIGSSTKILIGVEFEAKLQFITEGYDKVDFSSR